LFFTTFTYLSAIRPLPQLQGVRSVRCHWYQNHCFQIV